MGFPSPAEDYREDPIDLASYLVQHPSATFYFKVSGNSMEPTIPNGALIVVDRSLKPKNQDIVLAILEGEFTIRRVVRTPRAFVFHPDNTSYKPVSITEEMDVQVWGVVTASVMRFRPV